MHLTIRQLQIFDAVMRRQSFTRAADVLHLTQPAVSMQMRQLEEQVGVPLFDQVGKQIQPTDAGRELHRHAIIIAAKMQDLSAAMEEFSGLRRGELDLVVASTANYFAPKLIAAFCRQHAKVQVRLQVSNQERILDMLTTSNKDLAIMGQPPKDSELVAQTFLDNPLVVIAAPTHPLAAKNRIMLKHLERETFITREPGSGTRKAAERHFSRYGVEFHSVMEMSSNEAIKQAVEAGLGLGILSLHTLELELAMQRLAVLNVERFPIMRQWFVVHRKGKRLSTVAQAFLDFLIREARPLASLQDPSTT
ncbi:MAG TPA: LysR family transcriptional regulator [Nitrosomonas europaea]|uniref:LysR family transcriptional regulator n=1 Tax=Nitrosomonas europaea TaxID=915 RepID=UPI00249006FD|nr:LysR family transcriptional regulator [Nitrosomonas europaea]HRO56894.1 LysR family transcriptional regulator [Nitrosomonas europaea]HUM74421.1 LysR family transcriptional regulator [Nitrosomonas europaea]